MPDKSIEIPIYDDVPLVKVHLTTNKHILSSDIALDQIDGEHHYSQLIEKGEWDENSDLSRRTVFTYIIQNPKQVRYIVNVNSILHLLICFILGHCEKFPF